MSLPLIIFGGGFDPPHISHVLTATWAASVFPDSDLWIVPCWKHSFGKEMASFRHRYEMCQRAFGHLTASSSLVQISAIEGELEITRTFDLVTRLKEDQPDRDIKLLVGEDNLAVSNQWYKWDEILKMAGMIVVGREGKEGKRWNEHLWAPKMPRISSTDIRAAVGDPLELHDGELQWPSWVPHLVPRRVLEYIRYHGLYNCK